MKLKAAMTCATKLRKAELKNGYFYREIRYYRAFGIEFARTVAFLKPSCSAGIQIIQYFQAMVRNICRHAFLGIHYYVRIFSSLLCDRLGY